MKSLIKSLLTVFMIACLFGCSQTKTLQRLGEEVYVYAGFEIPSALGKPGFKVDELKEKRRKDVKDMADDISNYADALVFMENKSSKGSDKGMYVNSFITLLNGDYVEIDPIVLYNADQYDRDISYYLLSIKVNGKYYLLDPFSVLDEKYQWLEGYDLEKGSFDSKEELMDAVNSGCPYDFIRSFYTPKDADGNPLAVKMQDDDLFYSFNGFDFLLDYGLPKLDKEDIDDLMNTLNSKDYEAVKNKIETIPDAIAFVKKCGFKASKMSSLVETDEYNGGDVGNICYRDDNFFYTISGVESLILKEGQCTSTSTLLKYLLDDDYEEFGYVNMWCESKDSPDGLDGHAINYFKDNGKYYLVSPSYYLCGDNAWESNKELWHGFESAEEMVQKLNDSYYPIGKQVMSLAYTYDGVYCVGDINGRGENCTVLVPTGSEVKACIGRAYDYAQPKHPTSQEYVIGIEIKN